MLMLIIDRRGAIVTRDSRAKGVCNMATRERSALSAVSLAVLLVSAGLAGETKVMTRGRVRLNGTTIVTDWGTPLRGACWGLDMCKCIFPKEDLKRLKQCGLNAIHVYTELTTSTSTAPIGYNAEIMDSIVSWCREESLYVIMTHGGPIKNSPIDKIADIWRFYAPRYADETHVVYEPKNEPDDFVEIARTCYPIIRESAPETHVLLISTSNIKVGVRELLDPVAVLGDEIDWTNASIAYHGYGTTGQFQEEAIKTCNDSGYGVTCTEFWPGQGLEQSYERAGISYCHFTWCANMQGRGIEATCDRVTPLNLSYVPDFGNWPQPHIDYSTLTKWQPWSEQRPLDGGVVYRLVLGGVAQGNARTVYDLSGRTLWRREGNATGGADRRTARILPGADSRVLVVGYGGD